MYDLGLFANVVCLNAPFEPVTYDGLFEKLYSPFLALTK